VSVCGVRCRSEVPLVIGIDGGTESIRAGLFLPDGKMVASAAAPYTTSFPRPGWAEQSPDDWYRCLGEAVRAAVAAAAAEQGTTEDAIRGRVRAMCVDTTCCTVVALDGAGEALRPALLWMDSRSAPQTERILHDCRGMDALKVNCNGDGPLRCVCVCLCVQLPCSFQPCPPAQTSPVTPFSTSCHLIFRLSRVIGFQRRVDASQGLVAQGRGARGVEQGGNHLRISGLHQLEADRPSLC
jgi:hypothetical protein